MNSERNADPYLEGERIRCLCFSEHAKSVNGISWSPKSNSIASCSQDGSEPRAHCICQEFLFHDKPLRSVGFHLIDTDMLVAASDDKSVNLWQIDPKQLTEI
uniref:Uncharacterized protein n=1 Tax=Glossina palpalis gambiensis TaxID=67801 RepID=A0A1B0AWE4_9MUSC